MYSGAGRIFNAADDNVPKSLASSFIDTSCIDNISWHLSEINSTFSWGRDTVISTETAITPKNSILYVGWRTDFFKFITNPRFAVSLLKVVSSKVFPSIRKLSRYTNIPIYSLQRTETGIFTNFVNNVGAGLSPKRRQRYVQGILPFEIYILSWLFVQWNTKKGVFEVQLA